METGEKSRRAGRENSSVTAPAIRQRLVADADLAAVMEERERALFAALEESQQTRARIICQSAPSGNANARGKP